MELPAEFQLEIREFARALPAMDYYRVLGVPRQSASEEIREGFFERSKLYHPDRYFRKELGPYRELLHEIYKRVVAAHDVLRDQKLRRGYDQTLPNDAATTKSELMTDAGPPNAHTKRKSTLRKPGTPFSERPFAGVERLRRAAGGPASSSSAPDRPKSALRKRKGLKSPDMMLKGLKGQLERSRAKAQRHYDDFMQAKKRSDWEKCVDALKLAMAFDPRDKRFHDELANVLPEANAERAASLREKADLFVERGEYLEGLPMLEEACDLLPTDSLLAHQVARLHFELHEDMDKAVRFGERAVSLDPDEIQFQKTLGQIYKAIGNPVKARRHLQRAWTLDPLDKDVKAELGSL